ncbi:MAG: DNA-directed RNA polymerase subunit H [archaeon ADurb.Bin336]|nr:MAG: DNA-directed RNA polymerase subunit H [archaeon ADurb.Bin336]
MNAIFPSWENISGGILAEVVEKQRHYLVPEHVLIKKEKVAELMAELGIKKEDLPRIYKDDAALKLLGAEKGDVVKIIRDSLTAGQSVYYRRVVNK